MAEFPEAPVPDHSGKINIGLRAIVALDGDGLNC
jgi:hypothetical protein